MIFINHKYKLTKCPKLIYILSVISGRNCAARCWELDKQYNYGFGNVEAVKCSQSFVEPSPVSGIMDWLKCFSWSISVRMS